MAMVSGQHWAVLQATQFSGFQVFVDLSSAFASLMRQLAFSGKRSDEHIRWLTQAFGMPDETFDDMRRLLSEPGALEQALVDPHMVACLHQLHEHTWFVMEGNRMAARTESGSQADDPLGDIFFMAVHTRASRLVRDRLREEGLLMELPYDENTPFWMPADKPTTTVSASDGAYLDDALYFQLWESAPNAMLAAKQP